MDASGNRPTTWSGDLVHPISSVYLNGGVVFFEIVKEMAASSIS